MIKASSPVRVAGIMIKALESHPVKLATLSEQQLMRSVGKTENPWIGRIPGNYREKPAPGGSGFSRDETSQLARTLQITAA